MAVLFAVDIGGGLVVMHTASEYARLMHGVDLEATAGMEQSLDEFLDTEDDIDRREPIPGGPGD